MFLLNNFRNDCVLQTIFMSKSDATRSVWCAFENYVVLWYFFSIVYICLCVFLLPVFWRIKVFINLRWRAKRQSSSVWPGLRLVYQSSSVDYVSACKTTIFVSSGYAWLTDRHTQIAIERLVWLAKLDAVRQWYDAAVRDITRQSNSSSSRPRGSHCSSAAACRSSRSVSPPHTAQYHTLQ